MTASPRAEKRSRDHWFPFFAADFLGATQTMTAAEVGVYLRLLLAEWLTGGLPPELDRLARIAGPELRKAWPIVGVKFAEGPDGLLRNRRLEEVRADRDAYAEQRRKAANSRWSAAQPDASADASAMHVHTPRTADADAGRDAKPMPLPLPPPPRPKSKDPSAAPRPSKASEEPPEFTRIRALYPKRAGGQPWTRARRAALARIAEGATWAELQAGVERYAAFVTATGKAGTEFVMQAATLFGPDRHFLEPWSLPPNGAAGQPAMIVHGASPSEQAAAAASRARYLAGGPRT